MSSSISNFIIGSSATAALLLTFALPGPAQAQRGPAARLNRVQHQQVREIREGVKSGELNRQQAARLMKREKTIRATEAQARDKGSLTGAQVNQLRRETEVQNAAIDRAEDGHNATPPTH